jgi:hypothetical protein
MLDHTERLNLHALLGAQRTDVGSIRGIWAIQDRIARDANQEKAIELKREIAAGQERVLWNPALSLPVKEFKFTDAEVARIELHFRHGIRMVSRSIAIGFSQLSRPCSHSSHIHDAWGATGRSRLRNPPTC